MPSALSFLLARESAAPKSARMGNVPLSIDQDPVFANLRRRVALRSARQGWSAHRVKVDTSVKTVEPIPFEEAAEPNETYRSLPEHR